MIDVLYIGGLMQKRRNSSALALELRPFCIKLSICLQIISGFRGNAD